MQKNSGTPRPRPEYPLRSVDNALRLLQLLRRGDPVRLTDAAVELGIAPSSAHRLMAMLIYRGFAVRDDRRRYVAGPALSAPTSRAARVRALRELATGPMELLGGQLDETVNLMIRLGISVRILHSIESSAPLRIGEQDGAVLRADRTAGGLALLAAEPRAALARLFTGPAAETGGHALDPEEFDRFCERLAGVRAAGYAINDEDSAPGVGAVGMAIAGPDGEPVAALAVAAPASRLDRLLEPEHLTLVRRCRDAVAAALRDAGFDAGI